MSEEICLACHKEWSKFYKDHTCDEITKLKKALEVANEALVKIDSSNDDMKYFNSEIDSILKEAQKQIKEIMEGIVTGKQIGRAHV